jgi:hypothetical protein
MKGLITRSVFAIAFLCATAISGKARAEEKIYSLNDEAACRDVNGKILQPRIIPDLPALAEKTRFGMVKAKNNTNGLECFFYVFEVGLDPPNARGLALCPDASVAQDKSSIAGTREASAGCSK